MKDFIINKSFTDNFKNNILKLIDHCFNLKRTYLTSSDVDFIVDQKTINSLQNEKEIDIIFKTNNLQDGFIYNYLNDQNDSYFVQFILQYNININIQKLLQAWKIAKKRFNTLRSRFSWENKIIQIIEKYNENDNTFFSTIELDQNLDENHKNKIVKDIQIEDRLNLFQLDKGNLFRVKLIKIKENQFISIFSFHHTLLDGWSSPIILNFVNNIYLKLIKTENVDLNINNDDEFNNLQNYLQSPKNKHYNYWNEKLKEIEDKNDLKPFKNNQQINENSNNKFKDDLFEINDEKFFKLKKITSMYGFTLNALFQFIWHKIFSIYSNTNQTIVGTTVSGRNFQIKNIENAVGCFINTLPLIVNHFNNDVKIIDKINEIQDSINEININSNVKLSKLQNNVGKLFEIIIVFENYPEIKNDKLNTNVYVLLLSYLFFNLSFDKIDPPPKYSANDVGQVGGVSF